MEMDLFLKGPEETNNVSWDEGTGEKGASLPQLMSKEVYSLRGEPLDSKLVRQILRRERATKEQRP
eukprot:10455801-Prorocentrum_lima.AAC.1